MVRLFKGVTKILRNHMLLDDQVVNSMPDMAAMGQSESNDSNKTEKVMVGDLKKGSIAYAEYREFNFMI